MNNRIDVKAGGSVMSWKGKRVAVLVEDLYQDLEVWYPILRLREADVEVVAVGTGRAKSYKGKYGYPIEEDRSAGEISADELDGIVIPGGFAPDLLRRHDSVLKLVKDCFDQGKVVAAICHAAWVLVSAQICKGRTATCFSAIKDDLVNAGANYVDREVVLDGNLITSRKPEDLPAFCVAILKSLELKT